jgi:hypothetical protein
MLRKRAASANAVELPVIDLSKQDEPEEEIELGPVGETEKDHQKK